MPKLTLKFVSDDYNKYHLSKYFSNKSIRHFHNSINDPLLKFLIRSQCCIDDNSIIKIKLNKDNMYQDDIVNKYTAWYFIKKLNMDCWTSLNHQYFCLSYSICHGYSKYKYVNIFTEIINDDIIMLFPLIEKQLKFIFDNI